MYKFSFKHFSFVALIFVIFFLSSFSSIKHKEKEEITTGTITSLFLLLSTQKKITKFFFSVALRFHDNNSFYYFREFFLFIYALTKIKNVTTFLSATGRWHERTHHTLFFYYFDIRNKLNF